MNLHNELMTEDREKLYQQRAAIRSQIRRLESEMYKLDTKYAGDFHKFINQMRGSSSKLAKTIGNQATMAISDIEYDRLRSNRKENKD